MLKNVTNRRAVTLTIVALVAVILAMGSFYTIRSTERGVLATFGKISDVPVEPGLHVKIPVIQTVSRMSIQTQKIKIEEAAYTKDIQTAVFCCEVNYDVRPSAVTELYRQVGYDYENKIFAPILRGVIKDAMGNFNATAIVENRDAVRSLIEAAVHQQLSQTNYFTNVKIQISNIDFDDKFENAIAEKQVAEQNALRAKNNTVRIEEEAKQKVIAAEAEAQAMKVRADALVKNPKLIEYEAVNKWNGVLPTYMMGNTVPFLNLQPGK